MALSKGCASPISPHARGPSEQPEGDHAYSEMMDRLWGERVSIHERFPGMKGRVLWDMVVRVYAIEHGKTLHFYKVVDGKRIRLLYRHPRNNRMQRSTMETYVQSILEHGFQTQSGSVCA